MDSARSIAVVFNADLVANGVPKWWLAQYGLTPDDSGALYSDGDGALAWQEYYADTDPTNLASALRFVSLSSLTNAVRLGWQGGVMATQYIESCSNLCTNPVTWVAVFTNPPPTSITNHLDIGTTNSPRFYRIRATR